ncbi:putative F-box domain-containing protein [Medicago truncatula]|uniref:F-box protein interaction domain protein n=1 Tax=Medicago truncatula TaxID=3880 RepID=G7LGR5_MEDTR|nr:F-box protein interaction domain protein [Medicago truncatula]RHN40296.1 putative F-box domain-containing protein [Medicago truncatula]
MAPTNQKVSNHVPEDIVFSIFSKLPLKSLNRFTCLGKSWTLLFENPYFMNMFYKNIVFKYHSLYDEASLLLNYEWKLYFLSGERFENKVQMKWPHPFDQKRGCYPCILGSSINGTLCIYDAHDTSTTVLWNPATEELKIIPEKKAPMYKHESYFTIHGFGYDRVRDDYKVLQHVVYIEDDWDQVAPPATHWDIYSLRSNHWKKLYVDMRQRYLTSEGSMVYLNGVCHWWGKIYRQPIETFVVSFDLANEVPVTTLFPFDSHGLKWFDKHLTTLNGFVAMIITYEKNTSSFRISISVLGEPGVNESWTKLFDVGPMSGIDHPIGAGKKVDIVLRKYDGELACLDLTT